MRNSLSNRSLIGLIRSLFVQKGLRFPFAVLFIVPYTLSFIGVLLPFVVALFRVELTSPPPTPLLEDRNGIYLSEYPVVGELIGFWDVDEPLPYRMKSAILAVEDRRFYSHPGVDVRSFGRAAFRFITSLKREGASTIAMQVARLQHPARRTLWNKAVESWTAIMMTSLYGREAVCAQYMKLMPQGNRIAGAAYAARRYFKKPLEDVSWAEAAFLAGLPKAPGEMNPFTFSGFENGKNRARLVLTLLHEQGYLDEEEYAVANEQLTYMSIPVLEERPPFAVHYILKTIQEFDRLTKDDIKRPIRTSLDWGIQLKLQGFAEEAMEKWRPLGAGNIAILVAEVKTGDIVGYVGSDNYFDTEHKGAIDYVQVKRSSGSTLKPFLYARGLEKRAFTPASIVPDLPIHLLSENGEFVVRNHDNIYLGPLLYRRALANSRNVAAVRVLEGVGASDCFDTLKRLGLLGDEHPLEWYGYGLILGGVYVSLEQLVQAYGVLANDGSSFELNYFADTKTDSGKEQIIDPYAVREISLFLSDPLSRLPSFQRLEGLEIPFPAAIKTGTSQGYRDAWAIAYSRKYVVGVWIGHPDNESMNNLPGMESADVVKAILTALQPEATQGYDIEPFPKPSDAVPVMICSMSGKLPGPGCQDTVLEYFREEEVPRTLCDVHRTYAVDRRTGSLPGAYARPIDIENRLFIVLPPEYAAWGASRGYGPPPVTGTAPVPSVTLILTSPPAGGRAFIDPELPRKFQTLNLQVTVEPSVSGVEWYVDGKLFAAVSYPYTARWPLEGGVHSFQVRVPGTSIASPVATFTVYE